LRSHDQLATNETNMPKLVIALMIAVVGAGPVMGSQAADVMAPVRQFINGFNRGDVKLAKAACTDGLFIIDDFPPHAWGGSGAISKWLDDLEIFGKKNGSSDWLVTLGKPRHVDVTDSHAYVVVPTNLSYKKKGQLVKEKGLMTLVLHKDTSGWRIAAWSWADD
jgi:ketosteroid isomerase-like protein